MGPTNKRVDDEELVKLATMPWHGRKGGRSREEVRGETTREREREREREVVAWVEREREREREREAGDESRQEYRYNNNNSNSGSKNRKSSNGARSNCHDLHVHAHTDTPTASNLQRDRVQSCVWRRWRLLGATTRRLGVEETEVTVVTVMVASASDGHHSMMMMGYLVPPGRRSGDGVEVVVEVEVAVAAPDLPRN